MPWLIMTISKQMDEVPVTFWSTAVTMISSTMYYKADAIHLVDVKRKK